MYEFTNLVLFYNTMSLTFEFESKVTHTWLGKSITWIVNSKHLSTNPKPVTTAFAPTFSYSKPPVCISKDERQARYLKGECFRCGEKYGPGHRCKTGTLKVLEINDSLREFMQFLPFYRLKTFNFVIFCRVYPFVVFRFIKADVCKNK